MARAVVVAVVVAVSVLVVRAVARAVARAVVVIFDKLLRSLHFSQTIILTISY